MNIYTELEKNNTQKAVALGLFDGVHLGHRAVIQKTLEFAPDIQPVALTFDTTNFKPKKKVDQKDIMSIEARLSALEKMGLKSTYIIDFNKIKEVSAVDFIHEILHNTLNAKVVCCGCDFRFGKSAVGDVSLLKEECEKLGIKVFVIGDVLYDGEKISSTRIRTHIQDGNIEYVNKLLGDTYFIKGEVIKGNQIGRTIDVPTINQALPETMCLPKFGVYSSRVNIDGVEYKGVTNIGIKPTIKGDRKPLSETHIIGLNKDLYGEKIEVALHRFIRDEKKFDSIEELTACLKMDIKKAIDILSE